jgi:quercetin dioxygenase-like cupin family protein
MIEIILSGRSEPYFVKKEAVMQYTEKKNLLKLLKYKKGASESLPLFENDMGSVALYAFDKDHGIAEHTHGADALVQVLEGEIVIRLDGQKIKLHKDDVFIIHAHQLHETKATKRSKMLLTVLG